MLMNKEQNVNFIQNSPLDIKQTYSSEFFIGQSTSKISIFSMV